MGRDRAVGFEVRRKDLRQKGLQGVHYGDRQGYPSSIPRSSRAQSSSPSIQQVTLAVLAYQLTQFKQFPIRLSRSVIRYPYRWLGATWVISLLVGSIAAVTLLRIDPVELQPLIAASPSEQTLSAQPQNAEQNDLSQTHLSQQHQADLPDQSSINHREQKSSLPLFALGTVAFSCAIGCLLLSYRLTSHQPKPQPRLPTRPQRLPRSPAPTRTQTQAQGTSRTLDSTVKETRSSSSEASLGATVAIVSPNESHPLDWDEPSLADHLDIRQRRPLSHWL